MKILKYTISALLIIIVSAMLISQILNDETLPEPSLNIRVEGMETVDYWLDLLVDDSEINYNHPVSGRTSLVIQSLINYQDEDGYHPAMATGSSEKFIGNFEGYRQSDGSIKHEFWGEGIPEEFKIIIQMRDGKLIISDLVIIKNYHSEVRFKINEIDENKSITIITESVSESFPWTRMLIAFFTRLFVTILIKLMIYEAFKLKSESSNIVTKTIFATQIFISIMLISQIFFGAQIALIVLAAVSVLALVAEIIIFTKYDIKQTNRTCVVAAIVGNAVVALSGFFLIYFIEWILF